MHGTTRLSVGTGNKRESVIAVLAIGRNRLPVATGWIREDDSNRASAIAAPEAIVTRAGDRPATPAQIVVEVGIESETEAFPVAVALVSPALSAEAGAPVGAVPAAAVLVAPPAWEHPAVVVDRGVVVAAADAVGDVSSQRQLGGINETHTA
jgi:hypothetical protein